MAPSILSSILPNLKSTKSFSNIFPFGCYAGSESPPSFITGNVRCLADETDEPGALMSTNLEFQECSLMCFTETFLQEHIPDYSISLPGFQTTRMNKDVKGSRKRKGSGIEVLVNNRWCTPGHASDIVSEFLSLLFTKSTTIS